MVIFSIVFVLQYFSPNKQLSQSTGDPINQNPLCVYVTLKFMMTGSFVILKGGNVFSNWKIQY